MVNNGEFTSLVRFVLPASRDHIPNRFLQQSTLARVNWTGWSFTGTNIGGHVLDITSMIGQYPCEDLIAIRQWCKAEEWFPKEVHTEKEVTAME